MRFFANATMSCLRNSLKLEGRLTDFTTEDQSTVTKVGTKLWRCLIKFLRENVFVLALNSITAIYVETFVIYHISVFGITLNAFSLVPAPGQVQV